MREQRFRSEKLRRARLGGSAQLGLAGWRQQKRTPHWPANVARKDSQAPVRIRTCRRLLKGCSNGEYPCMIACRRYAKKCEFCCLPALKLVELRHFTCGISSFKKNYPCRALRQTLIYCGYLGLRRRLPYRSFLHCVPPGSLGKPSTLPLGKV